MTEQERFQRLHKLLLSLNAISAEASDSDSLLSRVVEETMRFTDASGAVVEMVDGDDLVYIKAAGQIASHVGLRVPRGNSLSGLCVGDREIKRCDDTENDPRVNREACRKIGIRSMLVVPLVFGGAVVGVLKASSEHAAAFTPEHVQALELAAGIIAATVGRQVRFESSRRDGEALSAELEASSAERESYRQAALIDALTGLPNRRSFETTLDAALLDGASAIGTMALLFVDMNDFKAINDTYGHKVGDHALRRVADVLLEFRRPGDTVARLAGDEFVILMRHLVEPEREIGELCVALQALFEAKQELADGRMLHLSIAIGASIHDHAGMTRSEWLHRADEAMYSAKQAGRFRFYGHDEPHLRVVGGRKSRR